MAEMIVTHPRGNLFNVGNSIDKEELIKEIREGEYEVFMTGHSFNGKEVKPIYTLVPKFHTPDGAI